MKLSRSFISIFLVLIIASCDSDDSDPVRNLSVTSVSIGDLQLNLSNPTNEGVPVGEPIKVTFSSALDASTIQSGINFKRKHTTAILPIDVALSSDNRTVTITPESPTQQETSYLLGIMKSLRGASGEAMQSDQTIEFRTLRPGMSLSSIRIGEDDVTTLESIRNVSPVGTTFQLQWSTALDVSTIISESFTLEGATQITLIPTLNDDGSTVTLTTSTDLKDWTEYKLNISSDVKGSAGEVFGGKEIQFFTGDNNIPDFPVIADEELLTLIQQQTFKYFWDFAEPVSGMARERNTSGNLVTSGGSGFGLMAIIVGIERNFITRAEGLQRLDKILNFLEGADRFHGAWSHWIDGTNGKVLPFSADDNGGDLVETALLVQGLITFRQYLDHSITGESALIDRINALWESVEWDWYRNGQDVLYWHWSPDKQWAMNHKIQGHNETLITYVLAASSPTHTIESSVYHNGYARGGAMANGGSYQGVKLPLGEPFGGPLFFSHYSFLGLDPRNLSDQYADYWEQNVSHSLIHYKYAIANPKKWIGYGENSWGLTASDNRTGYAAHSPTNDLGVITPTAALSSFPYTPDESMDALKFYYYSLGDRLWGEYGFHDAFNLTEGWTADSYLAIDQGPIIIMIENHRTGLLWDLFMSAPEIQSGLEKLGFDY